MAYEEGMPMHIAGTAMTWGTVWLFPTMIPLAIYMTLGTSNPGMIDAAGKHWEESKKKVEKFDADIKSLKKAFDADPKNWSADDKLHFDSAVNGYLDELKKVRDTVDTAEGLIKAVAVILYVLCVIVMVVGAFLLAIALLTIAQLPIPFVGEAVYSAAQTAALTVMYTTIPIFTTIEGFLKIAMAFLLFAAGVAGGTYGSQFVNLGTTPPDFKDVKVQMPNGPIKS